MTESGAGQGAAWRSRPSSLNAACRWILSASCFPLHEGLEYLSRLVPNLLQLLDILDTCPALAPARNLVNVIAGH